MKVRTPCSTPRCPNLSPCAKHARRPWQANEGLSAAERGYGAEHRRWRAAVLALHPMCQCGAVATDADHVVPVSQRPDLRYDVGNGQGLCSRCHRRKTASVDSKLRARSRRRPPEPHPGGGG